MHRPLLVFGLFLAGIEAVSLNAQVNTSALAGIVTDESGSVAPNVEITAVQEATGLTRKTTTNDTGEYVLPQLPPGRYELTAQAKKCSSSRCRRADNSRALGSTSRKSFLHLSPRLVIRGWLYQLPAEER